MPKLIRPEKDEMNVRKQLYKDADMSGQMLSDWYEKYVEKEDRDTMYRLIWCGGCGDYVGECGYTLKDGRHYILLYIAKSRRRCGYGSSALELLKQEAEKNGIKKLYALSDKQYAEFWEYCGFTKTDSTDEEDVWKCRTALCCESECKCRE